MTDPHEPDPVEELLAEHRAARPAADDDGGAAARPEDAGPDEVIAEPAADGGGGRGSYVSVRPGRGGGGRRWGLFALGVLLLVVLVVGAAGWWVRGQVDPGDPGPEVAAFTIPSESSTSDIADLLHQQGIITNATVFEWYVRLTDSGAQFQAGEYDRMHENSAMGDVVDRLKEGPLPPRDVSFLVREGLWLSETRDLILQDFPRITPEALDAALTSVHDVFQPEGSDDLEGFLFPATYEIPEAETDDPTAIITRMVEAFDQVAAETGLAAAPTTLAGVAGDRVISPYEALIVASLVESEAKVPEDRAKIARVIYNRLDQGMTLGIDATVLYALGERTDSLTSSQLDVDSPYNTRKNTGLPPTPINSPGRASIEAALNPAEGDWTYYVLTDTDGSHYFTDDYDDFQRAVRDAQERGVF